MMVTIMNSFDWNDQKSVQVEELNNNQIIDTHRIPPYPDKNSVQTAKVFRLVNKNRTLKIKLIYSTGIPPDSLPNDKHFRIRYPGKFHTSKVFINFSPNPHIHKPPQAQDEDATALYRKKDGFGEKWEATISFVDPKDPNAPKDLKANDNHTVEVGDNDQD